MTGTGQNRKLLKDKRSLILITRTIMPTKKVAAPAPVPVPAPKVDEVPAKVAAKKVAAAPAAPPVVKQPAPVEPVPAAAVEPVEGDDVDGGLAAITDKIGSIVSLLKEVQGLIKAHGKVFAKVMKQSKKAEKKRAQARKAPSGFAKPSKLSDEMCAFLKVPAGTEMARVAVTKQITTYIKENNLFDPTYKRRILPNATLKKLFNSKDGDEVTYFKLQNLIKHHFLKA